MGIRVLSPTVAAHIAAGEVVEGPASVVKELVENALDAGASAITVEVQGGGLELIRVADNGTGVATADVVHLFQRHATSKLTTEAELETVSTLGFRGEALHSMAAVSWVTLLTRQHQETAGTYVEARDGRALRQEPRGAPTGTTVTVHHLFQSVPARRKFLRSAQAELARVQRLLTLYVLAYPEVRFTLLAEGRQSFVAPGSGILRDAVQTAYGTAVARVLLELPGSEEGTVQTTGLVSPPDFHRTNRSYIALFVNRRPVQSRSLTFAVVEAYQGLLPSGRNPIAVLSITLPQEEVDVNVHPAKSEVRFRRESEVFSALQRRVREVLVTQAPVHAMQPPTRSPVEVVPGGPLSEVPLGGPWDTLSITSSPLQAGGTEALARPLERDAPVEEPQEPVPLTFSRTLPALRVVGQVRETYIIAEGPEGMYLIDQHAAHECILYERIRQAAAQRTPQIQGLLEPALAELSLHQADLIRSQGALLEGYGWQLEPFGEHAHLIRGMPAVLTQKGPTQALVDLLDALREEEPSKSWEERMAATVACHGSVRAGTVLAFPEMVELIHLLEQTHQPHTCPHGRPTLVHLSTSQLEREFRRR